MTIQDENGMTVTETRRGLSVLKTVLFLVGDVAGSGILAFPWALSSTGWIGVLLMITFAGAAVYTADLLGRCWTIVRHRYEEYRDQPVRHPYALIGEVAFGKPCSMLISFSVNFTSCGCCVAFLLLVGDNLKELLTNVPLTYGLWIVILAAFLCPFCWLGTPKDFWTIALSASAATAIAGLIIVVQIAIDAEEMPPAFHDPVDIKKFLMALGILCFGFGGHQAFPTIQVDMNNPDKFGLAAAIGFSTVVCMYLPVAIAGFLVYGSDLHANLLLNLLPGPLRTTAVVLISLHLMAAFVILLNPFSQQMEDIFKVPNCFCVRRVILRTLIVAGLVFVALSLPQFGAILSLVGGSAMTVVVFIMPTICYLKLCSMKGNWDTIEVLLHEKVICVEILVVGGLAGVAATYSALDALLYSHFEPPLYLKW